MVQHELSQFVICVKQRVTNREVCIYFSLFLCEYKPLGIAYKINFNYCFVFIGENTVNGDHSDAHMSTFSHSSKEVSLQIPNIMQENEIQ